MDRGSEACVNERRKTFGRGFEVGPVTCRGARHGETSNEDLDVRSVTHELEFLGRRLDERGRHSGVEQNRDAGSPSVRGVGLRVRRGFLRRRSGRRGGELRRRGLLHFTDLGRNRGGRGFESGACGGRSEGGGEQKAGQGGSAERGHKIHDGSLVNGGFSLWRGARRVRRGRLTPSKQGRRGRANPESRRH